MSEQMTLTAHVWLEDDLYVAQCLEIDIASQGETVEEALANLREAVEFYLEPPTATELPKLHTFTFEAPRAA